MKLIELIGKIMKLKDIIGWIIDLVEMIRKFLQANPLPKVDTTEDSKMANDSKNQQSVDVKP